jgi:hypothetical protein
MDDKEFAITRLAKADSRVKELVKTVQSVLYKEIVDLKQLKQSLIDLFEYLSSENGRTDQNCSAVDNFFMFDDLWVERNLPEPFQDIFGDMPGLHNAVSAPQIAGDFSCTPEQLLERARQLSTEPVNRGDG